MSFPTNTGTKLMVIQVQSSRFQVPSLMLSKQELNRTIFQGTVSKFIQSENMYKRARFSSYIVKWRNIVQVSHSMHNSVNSTINKKDVNLFRHDMDVCCMCI